MTSGPVSAIMTIREEVRQHERRAQIGLFKDLPAEHDHAPGWPGPEA
jgi:hypothetical protein